MRYKQHERKCEVCGNIYLFYQELPRDPMETPDSMLYGDHPSRCFGCVGKPDEGLSVEDKLGADLDEIKADLDAKKEEVEEKAEEKVPGYPPSVEDEVKTDFVAKKKEEPGYPQARSPHEEKK